MPSTQSHLSALDGVRGLAAAVVVVAHSANHGLLPIFLGDHFGQQAVLLFFVLSGFLMMHLYAERPFNKTEILRYARHRLGRVVPLFYLIVLLSWFLANRTGWLWLFPIDTNAALRSHMLFTNGVDILWTIPVEVQFYAVFVGLWFAYSKQHFSSGVCVVLLIAIITLLIEHAASRRESFLPATVHFFLIGALIAHIRNKFPIYSIVLSQYSRWLLLATLLFAIFSSSPLRSTLHLPVYATWKDPILGGLPVLVFICALQPFPPFTVLNTHFFRWLGKISYGIYIFHYPVVMTVRILVAPKAPWQGAFAFFSVCGIVLVLASASYHLFEHPLRQLISSSWKGLRAPATS